MGPLHERGASASSWGWMAPCAGRWGWMIDGSRENIAGSGVTKGPGSKDGKELVTIFGDAVVLMSM